MSDLIYDVGLHAGEDSLFYLLKGFRVVAVDANPAMCRLAGDRLARFVRTGQLRIVNAAIADRRGRLTFFENAKSDWSTLVREWDEQNAARGSRSREVTVEGITLADLVAEHGDAYYMKIDIEGMDRCALETLATVAVRPKYVSLESAFPRDPSFDGVKAEFDTLTHLGYDRFKIVAQHRVEEQLPPNPAAAGEYFPYKFDAGSSGLFGEEAPGDWMDLASALEAFRAIIRDGWPLTLLHRRMALYIRYCGLVERFTGKAPDLGWYDIHARHSSVD